MFDNRYEGDYTSVNVGEFGPSYDNAKSYRKQSLWRYWNRLSSLQRSVVCLILILGTFCIIYLYPHLFHRVEEVDKFSRKSKHSVDAFQNVVPPKSSKDFAKDAIADIKRKANEALQKINKSSGSAGSKRGPPVLQPPGGGDVANQQPPNGDSVLEGPQGADKLAKVVGDVDGQKEEQIGKPDKSVHDGADPFGGPMNAYQQAVVEAFKHAWKAYKKYAWGKDTLQPMSKNYETWFDLGLTLIDSLDTMYIMGLKDDFKEARDWVANDMNLAVDKDVNLFECTIRVLGGLLSAYHLSNDQIFLDKATELGDRLLPAFKSGSPVPYSDVNLKTGRAHAPRWGPDSSTSEVTTIQLEFRDLSRLTGKPEYAQEVNDVVSHVHNQPKDSGLVPIFINANTGRFRGSATITLGARGDSYYEYLFKMWVQSGKKDESAKLDFIQAVEGVKEKLIRQSEPNKLTYIGELLGGHSFSPKMDHLVCFMGGTLALAGHMGLPADYKDLGAKITETCWNMYKKMPTGLSPEIVYFNMAPNSRDDLIVKPADAHNLLRPETVESLFYLYRITGDKKYQEWGWAIFQSFEKYTKLSEGYSSISNVRNPGNPGLRNKMESFFLGETLKYFYLLFSDNPNLMPLDKWVFNTEAHPLPVFQDTNKT